VVLFFAVHDRPATYGIPPPDGPPTASASGRAVTREQLRMLKNPLVWVLSLAGALFYMARYGVNNWMPLYLQEAKGYSVEQAAAAMSVLATAGLFGSVLFGPISDWLLGSRRGPLVTAHGLVLIASLLAIAQAPAESVWLARCAFAACGYALGGLLVLLGGLGVVDVCPRGTSGAAVGVAGFCCYLGASLQDKISGHLIDAGRTVVGGVARYDFTQPMRYWVGAAVLSTLLSSVLWRVPAPARVAADETAS
jgi:OPA family sugar phosphate sensor protein UhpC-like MFS transporter